VKKPPLIIYKKALQALHTLRRYKKQNKHRNLELLRQLQTHKKELSLRFSSLRKQVRLDKWFLGSREGEN
jgi:hypothetical protein